MSAGEALHLSVEIDRDASPVSGRVAAGHGSERRGFVGWTELFAALQAAIADDHVKDGTRC